MKYQNVRVVILRLVFVLTAIVSGCQPVAPRVGSEGVLGTGRRLDSNIAPISYDLRLRIAPEREEFVGTVAIVVDVARKTSVLWLHGQSLNVTRVAVERQGEPSLHARFEQVSEDGLARIHVSRAVQGRLSIRFDYRARFDTQLRGLYRVSTASGHVAFTQFEPNFARFAFPCFDEPRFKTPFSIELVVPTTDRAIANTPATAEQTLAGGFKRVRFATTQKLPTYLVAWAVGPLDIVEAPAVGPNAVRSNPVPLRGIATRGRSAELQYALRQVAPILRALEEYVGIPYPFEKLDLIAVPDFAFGAMENPGAITFREQLLLMDEANAAEDQRQVFTYVLAHELAHQWFGNMVTLAWWDDLWLNEALATWLGYRVVAAVAPDQNASVRFLEAVHEAMKTDALATARKIRQPIRSAHDIQNSFDGITYNKGAGVLRMFEHWIGEETFQRGLHAYVRRHAWANATAEDLANTLSSVTGRDLEAPLRSFLDQVGVPFIDASVRCDHANPVLHLAQSRFVPLGSNASRTSRWRLPICIRYETGDSSERACLFVSETQSSIPLQGASCDSWLMPNADASGYYEWRLPADELARLLERGWTRLSSLERLSVARSVQSAFESGALPFATLLRAFEHLAADAERAVAMTPVSILRFFRDHVIEDAMHPRFEAYVRKLYRARYEPLRFSGGDYSGEDKLWREALLEVAATLARDPEVRKAAVVHAERYLRGDPNAVAPELLQIALRTAVQDVGTPFWTELFSKFQRETDAWLRSQMLSALGSTTDPLLAVRARELALSPALRMNEMAIPVRVQMAERKTREATWAWIQRRYDALVRRGSAAWLGQLPWFAAYFCSSEKAQQAQRFFGSKVAILPGGPRNLANTVEAIGLCAARTRHYRGRLPEW